MKRTLLIMMLPLALVTSAQWLNRAPSLDGYELVFSDEFNGSQLDADVWNIEVNGNGGGNNELQYYLANNVKVADGSLVLRQVIHLGTHQLDGSCSLQAWHRAGQHQATQDR